jgi:hypothetical protein
MLFGRAVARQFRLLQSNDDRIVLRNGIQHCPGQEPTFRCSCQGRIE